MAFELNGQHIEAIAPDVASVTAGRKLANAALWRALGSSERGVWGECRGYHTQAARGDWATGCSCPSRKSPCKHALALLFLAASSPALFPAAPEPEWVGLWHAQREAAARRKTEREQGGAKPVDEEARAKRATRRHGNVLLGIDQLETWLVDLLRRGLGRLPSEGFEYWDAQARRLVDAQAPGLAARVRGVGNRVAASSDWAERVLGELGLLSLLAHAYRRLEALPPALAHDVRRLVGFTLDQGEVLAHGDVVEDEWIVVSSWIDEDERLRVQRSWLVGQRSARRALVLAFAAGFAPFAEVLAAGTAFPAKLAFWPGASPQRALIVQRLGATALGRVPPHARSITNELEAFTEALARDPWLSRGLFLLDGVRVATDDRFYLVDGEGAALPMFGDRHDVLWALCGGRPLLVAAEWNGFGLDPLAAYPEGRCVMLRGASEGDLS